MEEGLPPVPNLDDEIICFGGLSAGTQVSATSNLFPRIDVKKNTDADGDKAPAPKVKEKHKEKKADKPAEAKAAALAPAATAGRPEVDFDHFKALDLRVGTVRVAERHPNADRILRLEIDFGEGQLRQILSGLAEYYAPDDLVGKQVCAVLNLAPRKIRGLMSHGMVLTAQGGDELCLLAVAKAVPDGSEIA